MKTKQVVISAISISAFGLLIYLVTSTRKAGKADQLQKHSSPIYIPNWNKPFNIEFADEVKTYLLPKRVSTLEPAKAYRLARQILSLKTVSRQIAEQSIKQIFSSLKSKVELSNLSAVFYKVSLGQDFYRFLESLLSNSSMQTFVKSRVDQLVNYQLL